MIRLADEPFEVPGDDSIQQNPPTPLMTGDSICSDPDPRRRPRVLGSLPMSFYDFLHATLPNNFNLDDVERIHTVTVDGQELINDLVLHVLRGKHRYFGIFVQ